ncbi:type I phosphodiesterase/nucleotide pyrophosphatase [Leptospira ryugenii]|uniref:Type I phosphodiesterase/nucleotide pyrophosphatase n=1 Tax=Leptospira ryugenii TaxID=1917863 RepID=A0A2P2E412_9LEPT|nr:sulfatase [Leptospira ryugenii]GBF51622.1 type I phosphodiesterase/nucleotide pyrophosphatase [Leptospira ryugenii]
MDYFSGSHLNAKIGILAILFCLLFAGCKEKEESLSIAYDLVLDLEKETTSFQGQFVANDPLVYHWKKNPGRQTSLPTKRKWQNTQITFNTDKELFINHSLDAIYFPPNTSYEFEIKEGQYTFEAYYGLLKGNPNQKNSEGELAIEVDGIVLEKRDCKDQMVESWNRLSKPLKISKRIKLIWKSNSDHLFLGRPLLLKTNAETKYNVIFIVLDSARKDFFQTYGFPYPITPNMDAFAKESVVFENPFSNGNWTKPSMMSFFHSEYSSNLGLGNSWFTTKPYQRVVYYGKPRYNLANIMRKNSYVSQTIMNNVFFLDYTTVGVDLGFHDSFQVGMDILDTEVLTNQAIQFVEQNKEKSFFLHFNLNTPHASYSPPPEHMKAVRELIPSQEFYRFESPVQRYMGELHYTDREVNRLFSKLKELGLYEKSLIILTGDHGELFSPHHDYSYHFIMQTRFGHGETHYDEEINVPYFIKLPNDLVPKKRFIPGQVSLLSILPTVLGLLGIKQDIYDFKGINFSECILNDEPCPKENTIYTEGRMSESMRTASYKYIRRYPGFTTVRRTVAGEPHFMMEELYDLVKDPEEKTNLVPIDESHPLLVKARSEFLDSRFLNRNRIKIKIPACEDDACKDRVIVNVLGSIYQYESSADVKFLSSSAKNLQMEIVTKKNPIDITIETVNPEFETRIQCYRNGRFWNYRTGRWGIEGLNLPSTIPKEFILSDATPLGWESSHLPWVYNDGSFSGGAESSSQQEMGKEVKKILSTWGYIHE